MSLGGVLVALAVGAVLVAALLAYVAVRSNTGHVALLRAHPANRLVQGELVHETAIPSRRAWAHVARVLWVDEAPGALADRLRQELAGLGFAPTDEPFRPNDVLEGDRVLVHMRNSGTRFAAIQKRLPFVAGPNIYLTEGDRPLVVTILEG